MSEFENANNTQITAETKLKSVEQLEKPEWVPLTNESFERIFAGDNIGKRVFPSTKTFIK